MQLDMNQFQEAFFEESAEHLSNLEEGLLKLETTPDDVELLHSIFRAAHSIKGASGMFGFSDVTRFTHAMENLLDSMRDGKIAPTPPLTDLLLRATDMLKELIAAAQNQQSEQGQADPPEHMESVLAELEQQFATGGAPAAPADGQAPSADGPLTPVLAEGEKIYQAVFVPSPEIFHQGIDPLLLLRHFLMMGEILASYADIARLPRLAEMDPTRCYMGWLLRVQTDQEVEELQEIFSFVEDESEIHIEQLEPPLTETEPDRAEPPAEEAGPAEQAPAEPAPAEPAESAATTASAEAVAAPPAAAAPAQPSATPPTSASGSGSALPQPRESSSIRVSTDKVDKLINLIGELVITQSMISQSIENFSMEKLDLLRESIEEMSSNTRELQERVMAVRMLPVSSTFNRFPRVVRDLAASCGKQVNLEISGEETELDKGVLERIGDPLTHLVRNAVDHGMETPEERLAAGKPEQGTIRLQAYHQGGNVIIEIADDGPGLNGAKLRQKAIDNGLISADEVLSEDQTHALVFHPGLSTAAVVSDVSGRGVGMDVVKRNIAALNGSISISSKAGKGTRFRVKLPLTLAIIDGLSLRSGSEVYVVPLLSILESIKPHPDHIKTVVGRGEVIVVRGEFLPLLRLYSLFDIASEVTDPTQGLVVIIENEGKKFGLLVDELLGQSQVVIKNLETNYTKVEGIVGATIMGDGQVALILDVQGLARIASREGGIPLSELEGGGILPPQQGPDEQPAPDEQLAPEGQAAQAEQEEQAGQAQPADEEATPAQEDVAAFTVPAATQAEDAQTIPPPPAALEAADGDLSEAQ